MIAPSSHLEALEENSEQPAPSPASEAAAWRIQLLIFGTILSTVLFLSTWFVTSTWTQLSGMSGGAWSVAPFVLTLGFVPTLLLGMRSHHPLVRLAYLASAVSLGLLTLTVAAALGSWAFFGAAAILGLPVSPGTIVSSLYGLAALTTVFAVVNANWLRTTHVTVRLRNLPAAWRGRRAALVSDVHLGHIRGYGFARRIVTRLRQLSPNIIFITGDMFDGTSVNLERVTQPWAALSAPSGAYFVSGNHDEFNERSPYLEALQRAGLRVLHNEKVVVDDMQIVGVHDAESGDPKLLRSILQQAEVAPERASILLAHQPRHLEIAEQAGISLQLSGHTHAGQFWPWSWVVTKVHGIFAYGLNRHGKMLVHTTSGAGTWGPPLRLGTQSEIVVLHFEPQEN